MGLNVIILAAGEGTRMRSSRPKVLHCLAGRPLLEHVVDTARAVEAGRIFVVYGHGGDNVRTELAHLSAEWVEQPDRLGTGHAVQQVVPHIDPADTVLVLYGDVPLIRPDTLRRLVDSAQASGLSLITARVKQPQGYGRIVRDEQGRIARIVEEKDANGAELEIDEVNSGIMAFRADRLARWLSGLGNDNAQGEYYLTDVVALAVAEGIEVGCTAPEAADEILGVNNRSQLAALERRYQQRQAERLMLEGVTLLDPARFDLRGELTAGRDVTIDVNVVLAGRVVLGDGVTVGPNTVIRDAVVADDVAIDANCVIENADIGPRCRIGPFSRIRPETALAEGVHVGNFVEIKKASVGAGTKINHLSYIGDASLGSDVNIGAGTITCNYDGANKHRTEIGDRAFIGSDTQLVAPVKVGAGATIGAGSTITHDAPAEELTLSRAPQQTRSGWKRPSKRQSKVQSGKE